MGIRHFPITAPHPLRSLAPPTLHCNRPKPRDRRSVRTSAKALRESRRSNASLLNLSTRPRLAFLRVILCRVFCLRVLYEAFCVGPRASDRVTLAFPPSHSGLSRRNYAREWGFAWIDRRWLYPDPLCKWGRKEYSKMWQKVPG